MRFLLSVMLGLIFSVSASAADFMLQSSALQNNQKIPKMYTCQGKNISPPLSWKNPPENTKSFVLILSSPDSPIGTTSYDWVLFNIPGDVKGLPENAMDNLPNGTLVGMTTEGDAIYRGPCPPTERIQHFVFTLYALNIPELDLIEGANVETVIRIMNKYIIGKAELTVTHIYDSKMSKCKLHPKKFVMRGNP